MRIARPKILATFCMLIAIVGSVVFSACSATPAASPTAVPAKAPSGAPATAAPSSPGAPAPTVPAPAVLAPTVTTVPLPYGELKVGFASFAAGPMDPQVSNGTAARPLATAVFDSLVGLTPEGLPGPGIAERWDVSPDARVWTFYIRKGVKFHDGSDLTGQDVKFSIERNVGPQGVGTNAASLRGAIEKLELKDDFTFVITLKKGDPEIWKWLAPPFASEGLIAPKKYIEEKGVQYFRDHLIGSGPWKVLKYDFNIELQLEAVPNHWRAKPQFKTVIIKNVPETATRLAMLKTGDLDLIDITPDKAAEAKAAGQRVVALESVTQGGFAVYPELTNMKALPVGDINVRKALSLAVNRQEIADALFAGYAKPNAVMAMAPTNPYFDANILKPDPYDPTQAKALLTQAGYANGFSIKLYPATSVAWTAMLAEAIAGYWQKLGLKTELVVMDYAAMRPMFQPVITPQIKGNAGVWYNPPYIHFGFRVVQHSQGTHKNHDNTQLDDLIDKTEAAMDMAERKRLAVQAAVVAKNEYHIPGVVNVSDLLAAGKKVGDWTPIKGQYTAGLDYERITHAK